MDEEPPRVAIEIERLGLATRAVQRQHELGPERLAERMLTDERLQLADELRRAAEGEVGVDAALERDEPKLLEPWDLGLRERLARQVGKSRSAPETERLAEDPPRGLGGASCASSASRSKRSRSS